MAETSKRISELDQNQVLRGSFNREDFSLTVNGFLLGKVGRRVTLTIAQTTVPDDTEIFNFSEDSGATALYEYTIVYTDDTRETMVYAERTA